MAWITDNRYLTQAEKENNANIIIAYYRSQGIDDRAIAGILGNIDLESTFSPTLTEVGGGGGYGLVQWTPVSVLQSHCNITGLSPYTSGDVQIQVILREMKATSSDLREWYTTSGFISNYYNFGASSDMIGITAEQFLSNSMNWDADKMAIMFMAGYERPLASQQTIHWEQRKERALFWYQYMGGQPSGTFTPRLDDTGIVGDFHYYSQNPFYQSGYGMPNCTCYAWGRFWEIGDPNDDGSNKPVNLSTGNGGQWFPQAVSDGYYQTGQTPQLGSVICFSDNNGGSGHVAIVEEIASDGAITCSNSAYQGTFFFLSHITPNNGRYDWSHYTCQGFIYNPYAFQPVPPTPQKSSNHWKDFILSKNKKYY